MTEPFVVINGHAPWCAYIRSLGWIGEDEDCDCVGWDDDDEWPSTYPSTDDEGRLLMYEYRVVP